MSRDIFGCGREGRRRLVAEVGVEVEKIKLAIKSILEDFENIFN